MVETPPPCPDRITHEQTRNEWRLFWERPEAVLVDWGADRGALSRLFDNRQLFLLFSEDVAKQAPVQVEGADEYLADLQASIRALEENFLLPPSWEHGAPPDYARIIEMAQGLFDPSAPLAPVYHLSDPETAHKQHQADEDFRERASRLPPEYLESLKARWSRLLLELLDSVLFSRRKR